MFGDSSHVFLLVCVSVSLYLHVSRRASPCVLAAPPLAQQLGASSKSAPLLGGSASAGGNGPKRRHDGRGEDGGALDGVRPRPEVSQK